mgnify:CR=1 FL=1
MNEEDVNLSSTLLAICVSDIISKPQKINNKLLKPTELTLRFNESILG